MENLWREGCSRAAGFFNAEGHVGFSEASRPGKGKVRVRRDLYLTISQTDPWVLNDYRACVAGLGRVTGPYARSRPNESPVYNYSATRFEHIQAIVAMMWQWLSPIKKAQATKALLAAHDRYTHSKTCKYGHPWTPENTYYSGKNYRHCKACRRQQWTDYRARQRALHPMPARDPSRCSSGHVLAEVGVYTYGTREMCKQCARDRAKKTRDLARTAAALLEA